MEAPVREGARPTLPTGTATFLFTDIQGSTDLVQRLDLEHWREVLATHHNLLREQWSAFGGHEVKTEGDAFFVVFDRAPQAVAACVAAQTALASYAWPADAPIRVRMRLHAG